MYHLVARAKPRTLLFRTWFEGCDLWRRLSALAPGVVAICLMPNHVHVLHHANVRTGLGNAMRGFARWRNAQRGVSGRVWSKPPPVSLISGRKKQWRNERYIHLNPCRAGLVADPLAWPLSTHRDAVGLTLVPLRSASRHPYDYHHRVSADPSVHLTGTELPQSSDVLHGGVAGFEKVVDAVSGLLRVPVSELARRGSARSFLVNALRVLSPDSARILASWVGVSPRQIQRTVPQNTGAVRLVARVLSDPRLAALHAGRLDQTREWRGYCVKRGIRGGAHR